MTDSSDDLSGEDMDDSFLEFLGSAIEAVQEDYLAQNGYMDKDGWELVACHALSLCGDFLLGYDETPLESQTDFIHIKAKDSWKFFPGQNDYRNSEDRDDQPNQ